MVEFEIDWKGNQLGINPQKLALKPRPFSPLPPPKFPSLSFVALFCRVIAVSGAGVGWGAVAQIFSLSRQMKTRHSGSLLSKNLGFRTTQT